MEKLEIRQLTENDLAAAMRLKELAHWNQTEGDWRRLLRLEPRGCFAGVLNGRIIASLTTTTYGKELAWIGMVIVDPEYRRQGIATQLMRTGLHYLKEQGIATIKLDATPAGRPAYEALDFVEESFVERWEGVARPAPEKNPEVVSSVSPMLLHALDRQAFGADRSRLLNLLVASSCAPPLAHTTRNGQSKGYCLARSGTNASYVGPLVAADGETALALLDAMLDRMAGEKVFVDFYTGFCTGTRVLVERGFVKQRDFIRMRYGKESDAGTSDFVFAIGGPEIG